MAKKNAAAEDLGADEAQAETEGMTFGDDNEGEGNVVDLSGVSERGNFAAIPRGNYPVVVSELTYDTSQRSGNKMWTWILEIESGEYAGRKLYYHTVFVAESLPRVKQALMRIQLEDGSDYAKELAGSSFDPGQIADEGRLVGGRFSARVDQRKYEGEMRNNVKALYAPQAQEGFLG